MLVVGVVLLLVGAALLVAEAHLPSGALGVAGGLALAVTVLWLAVATRKGLATRRLRASSGREALSGQMGVVRNWTGADGQVFVDGALWRARRSWPDDTERLDEGDQIVVERVSGLTLAVRRAEEWEQTC